MTPGERLAKDLLLLTIAVSLLFGLGSLIQVGFS